MHSRQEPLQRQGSQFADGQSQRPGAGHNGGVAKPALFAMLQDLPDGVAIQIGDAGKILLVPATFLHQAGNLSGKAQFVWRRGGRHGCDIIEPAPRD